MSLTMFTAKNYRKLEKNCNTEKNKPTHGNKKQIKKILYEVIMNQPN